MTTENFKFNDVIMWVRQEDERKMAEIVQPTINGNGRGVVAGARLRSFVIDGNIWRGRHHSSAVSFAWLVLVLLVQF